MRNAFEIHREKRISEIAERLRESRIKKRQNVIIFSQNTKKACEDINQI
jgi:hypothetical protein